MRKMRRTILFLLPQLVLVVGLFLGTTGSALGQSLANGDPCSTGSQCTSGNCVDDVCCNSSCNGAATCVSCNLVGSEGTCALIPNGEDPDDECVGGEVCDGGGSCTAGPNGVACTAGVQCTSGNCVDGVCCDTSCGGTCESCNQAGSVGSCTAIPDGQDPIDECSGAEVCNGAAGCRPGEDGLACTAGVECSSGNCVDGVCCDTACAGTCESCNLAGSGGVCTIIPDSQDPDDECTGAQACDGAGNCRQGDNGVACGDPGECLSGNCVDGLCCNTNCGGTCVSCNLAGLGGICSLIPDNQDPDDECTGAMVCSGSASCRLGNNGTACTAFDQCQSGNCTDGVCCNTSCTGNCESCDQAGSIGSCALIPDDQDPIDECPGTQVCNGSGNCRGVAPDGTSCQGDIDCASEICTDGVCCATSCSGTCELCSLVGSKGTCSFVPDGGNPGGECGTSDVCDGSGGCREGGAPIPMLSNGGVSVMILLVLIGGTLYLYRRRFTAMR